MVYADVNIDTDVDSNTILTKNTTYVCLPFSIWS